MKFIHQPLQQSNYPNHPVKIMLLVYTLPKNSNTKRNHEKINCMPADAMLNGNLCTGRANH